MTIRNNKTQSGRLRIVAGKWRSRLLQIANVEGLRPTSQRIRETLFNWLAPSIHGSRCLDICAGTGALGLEALSRGASAAVFVEKSAAAAEQLAASISVLDAAGATVVKLDASAYLREPTGEKFDIVFMDPPFADDMLAGLCKLLVTKQWLADGALVYIEFDDKHTMPEIPAAWSVLKDKTAGNVRCMLITTKQNQEPQ